eukprot:TRINITY_DN2601_c0_g1_i1.p1 TRINITY_DN2601_c0_g1~~TRINITY_DN2601_c0_g1_i1.p1  ORF type:complete len:344 (-),score=81.70 TRINITY_DN2601_c0_g1_i1:1293-2324(-)
MGVKRLVLVIFLGLLLNPGYSFRVIVNTWPWTDATDSAYEVLARDEPNGYLDALESGLQVCQELGKCASSVGYGGSPDENGETTLDAMIMDGKSMNVGAVASLRWVRNAIGVARKVMDHTEHTLLVGDLASEFAYSMGFRKESSSSVSSVETYEKWLDNQCQPNYWNNVSPDPKKNCGPYKPTNSIANEQKQRKSLVHEYNHDTISMFSIDSQNNIGAGSTTNGLTHKIAGRVGDSPIMGCGAYADNRYGACGATGDGDIMMRFLPCYSVISMLKLGKTIEEAAKLAIEDILHFYPNFVGAIVAIDKNGSIGSAAYGWPNPFHYSFRYENMTHAETVKVPNLN